jgi:hypothetical protein
LRALKIDDFVDVYINGHKVIDHATFGAVVPWTSFVRFLMRGSNEIRLVIANGQDVVPSFRSGSTVI